MADIETPVPRVTLAIPDPAKREAVRSAIEKCCAARGIAFADIAETSGQAITVKLNMAEGMMLFKNDPLLDTQLGLFDGSKPHTAANLKEMNEHNSAQGVSVSRWPSLDMEFKTQLIKAEEHIKHIAITAPKKATSDEVIAAHHVTAIGEIHEQQSGRLTIAAKLPQMGRTGGALLMEGIPQNRQPMLDAYLAGAPTAPIPPLLQLSLEAHAGTKDYSAIRLLEDAKKAHVPAYAFDSDAALLANYWMVMKGIQKEGAAYRLPVENPETYTGIKRENPLDYRLLLMNEAASAKVDAISAAHPGKILLSVGGSHALPENGIPGIGDFVGGGQLAIYDTAKGEAPSIETTREVSKMKDYIFPIQRDAYLKITADPEELKKKLEPELKHSGASLSPDGPEALLARCRELNGLLAGSPLDGAHPSGLPALKATGQSQKLAL